MKCTEIIINYFLCTDQRLISQHLRIDYRLIHRRNVINSLLYVFESYTRSRPYNLTLRNSIVLHFEFFIFHIFWDFFRVWLKAWTSNFQIYFIFILVIYESVPNMKILYNSNTNKFFTTYHLIRYFNLNSSLNKLLLCLILQ